MQPGGRRNSLDNCGLRVVKHCPVGIWGQTNPEEKSAGVIVRDISGDPLPPRRIQRVPKSPTWSPMTPK
ncbi:hypothetical protein TNCV_712381 [Trichonephila clavipes]|nr:hypothetical protein TNCV_712381 [Trichonephila clavipes]